MKTLRQLVNIFTRDCGAVNKHECEVLFCTLRDDSLTHVHYNNISSIRGDQFSLIIEL